MKRILTMMFLGVLFISMLPALMPTMEAEQSQSTVDWWPMFHHDLSRSGYSSSTAPTTNQTRWMYKIQGSGGVRSSPAVANGVVYLNGNDGWVYALNASTGTQIWIYGTHPWSFDIGSPSSPAVANDIVYVTSYMGNVYALNASTGTQIWNYTTVGGHSSPVVANGIVYVGQPDNLYALNASTGTQIWNYAAYVESSPAVAEGTVYAHTLANGVCAFNATTGALLWSNTAPIWSGLCSSPAIANGVVYVGAWGDVWALNATTGASVWSTAGSAGFSSAAVANGIVYVGSQDHNVYALNASTGTQMWQYGTEGPVVSSPAIASDIVFVGSWDSNAYALNATTGALIWKYETTPNYPVTSSPAVANGVVYIGGWDSYVYAIGSSLSISVSPGSVAMHHGQSQTFTVTASGGSTPYSYQWYVDGAPISGATNPTWMYTASASVSFGVYVEVKDGTGEQASSRPTTVTVVPVWIPTLDSYSQANFGSVWSAGGNCYGLSSTEILYFMHYVFGDYTYPYFPAQNPPPTWTSDLVLPANHYTLNNAALAVMFHQVYDPNCIYVSPSSEKAEYDKLVQTLDAGVPALLCMHGTNAAGADIYHAIVAYGIGPSPGAGLIDIKVSDPNHPQQEEDALYDPSIEAFGYFDSENQYDFDQFIVVTPQMISTSWTSGSFAWLGTYWWWHDWLSFSVTGYNIVITDKMVTVESGGLKDYFTAWADSQTFVQGIPGSSGIQERNVQVYAIPGNTPFSVSDPGSSQSTMLITRVENESGQPFGYGYLLNATTEQGPLDFSVTSSNSSLLISAGANPLNASVTSFFATQQGIVFQTVEVSVGAMQTVSLRHDVAVVDVTPYTNWTYQGRPINVNVTVADVGDYAENATVKLCYNGTAANGLIGTKPITLARNETGTLTFTWNTESIPICYSGYNITASIDISPEVDSNPTNNALQSLAPAFVFPYYGTGSIAAEFTGIPIKSGNFVWFSSNFQIKNHLTTKTTIWLVNSKININGVNYSAPNAQITFDPSATFATTSFDEATNTWKTIVPLRGDNEIFMSGTALHLELAGKAKVTWTGDFYSDANASIIWKWSAAVYTKFSTDYTKLNVKPTHTNAFGINNLNHAGTPENYRKYVIGGAMGGGGSCYTGGWSDTQSVQIR